ncbi:hypothetical protein C7B82_22370 [Stenomitos frigidus ULC18]|uniref:Uncharacterized protein n=1 Tax=Stenomitos frigidus ULC18 TaxID=2107698 RepID=A0A2T1DYZ5_9CYAN|nr:hypothetical protein C7B82_22370 [Stenomitos frigidus ULC18]
MIFPRETGKASAYQPPFRAAWSQAELIDEELKDGRAVTVKGWRAVKGKLVLEGNALADKKRFVRSRFVAKIVLPGLSHYTRSNGV